MERKKLTQIKSGAFSRGVSLARLTVSAGAKVAAHSVGSLFANEEEKATKFRALLLDQARALTLELGQLKGSLMKAGQMLSLAGEHFLPPEVNAILKSLQSQSPPLDWPAIQKVLLKQLSPEKLTLIEINPSSFASASLGQVHEATEKKTGRRFAIKIQYPGVDAAIDSDIATLKKLLSVTKILARDRDLDPIFNEVREMLHREVNYTLELESTLLFRQLLANTPNVVIPEPVPEFCTNRILTTTLEAGLCIDDPKVLSLPQERRNAIGKIYLELYLNEIFKFKRVQTDPHFGNYRIRLSPDSDQLVCYDFGAIKEIPDQFLKGYGTLLRGGLERDWNTLFEGADSLGIVLKEDNEEIKKTFRELSELLLEPFYADIYDWGESDLPKRVVRKVADLAFHFKFRIPPKELVFLDRKMGGVFIFLSTLKCRINAGDLLRTHLSSEYVS